MKKLRLTESELIGLIKKVISEQGNMFATAGTPARNISVDKKKEDINPKKLKLGDGGDKRPHQINDVKILQQKLIDLGFLVVKAPTGYFGPGTEKALQNYYNSENNSNQAVSADAGFILVFSFPDYQPTVQDTFFNRNIVAPITKFLSEQSGSGSGSKKSIKLGKLGHGGCVVITKDGNATLYEFGRYDSNSMGSVKQKDLGRVAKITNNRLLNAQQVARIAKKKTEGDGPRLAMDVVVRELPNPAKAKRFAEVKRREYTIADPARGGAMNCGTYALEVALEGGVDSSFMCFPSPVEVVTHLKPGLQTFTV